MHVMHLKKGKKTNAIGWRNHSHNQLSNDGYCIIFRDRNPVARWNMSACVWVFDIVWPNHVLVYRGNLRRKVCVSSNIEFLVVHDDSRICKSFYDGISWTVSDFYAVFSNKLDFISVFVLLCVGDFREVIP